MKDVTINDAMNTLAEVDAVIAEAKGKDVLKVANVPALIGERTQINLVTFGDEKLLVGSKWLKYQH